MMHKLTTFFAIILASLSSFSASAQNPMTHPHAKQQPAEVENPALLKKNLPHDVVIGEKDAPVTMIEYASLSCPHCAKFHEETYPELYENYIETGKLKLIFRHFPLNASALKASMLVSCAPEGRQEKFLKALFESQVDWAFEKNFVEKLRSIAKIGGLSSSEFEACMKNQQLEDDLLMMQLKASRDLKVSSTPTFFIGNVRHPNMSFEDFSKLIEEQLE